MTDPSGKYEFIPSPDNHSELGVFISATGSYIGSLVKVAGRWFISWPHDAKAKKLEPKDGSLDGAARHFVALYERDL